VPNSAVFTSCGEQTAFGLPSPGREEEQVLSVRKKTDGASGFDGCPHPHLISMQSSSPFQSMWVEGHGREV